MKAMVQVLEDRTMTKYAIGVLMVMLIIGTQSCVDNTDNSKRNLHIRLENVGRFQLYECKLGMNGGYTLEAPIAPARHASIGFWNEPIADKADVIYQHEDGEIFTNTVAVKSLIPSDYKGDITLVFKIDSDAKTTSVEIESSAGGMRGHRISDDPEETPKVEE